MKEDIQHGYKITIRIISYLPALCSWYRKWNKKNQYIMNNAISEIKNTLEGTNSRIKEAEDRVSEVQDRIVEINE